MFLLLVVMGALVDAAPHEKHQPKFEKVPPICTSEHCVGAAGRLYFNMNKTADPCDDFEEFACGRFKQNVYIPDDKGKYSALTPLADIIYERGRRILEADDRDEEFEDWELFRTTKKFYKSCMNLRRLEELGVKPMLDSLKLLGGWPVVEGDDWNSNGYQWWWQVYQLTFSGFGMDNIIKLSVETDGKDSTKRSIILDQPNFGLSREFLVRGLEEPAVKHYFTYMKSAAKLMGAPHTDRTEKELKDALMFEIQLSSISGMMFKSVKVMIFFEEGSKGFLFQMQKRTDEI